MSGGNAFGRSKIVQDARRAAQRQDGWFDTVSGLGVDCARPDFAGVVPKTCQQLATVYDGDWLGRRVVDILPREAQRKPFTIKDDPDGKIVKAFNEINFSEWNTDGAVLQGQFMGRLMAGSGILMGIDSDPSTELPEGAQEIKWLDVARRDDLAEAEKDDDPNSATFGKPLLWEIVGQHPRRGMRIHASRVVLCEGLSRTDRLRYLTTDGYPFPWISVLQPILEGLKMYGLSWTAVSHLLKEASIGVFKLKSLISAIGSEDETAIDARLAWMTNSKSATRSVYLDADKENGEEDFKRVPVSFADIPGIVAELAKYISALADVPTTVLFGMSPAGLNATGESDMTQWYDRVCSYQHRSTKPKLERICSILAGKPVEVEFAPLWEPTASEATTMRYQQAQADQIYYTINAVEGIEIRKSRDEDGTLGIDVENPEALPGLDEPDPVGGYDAQGNPVAAPGSPGAPVKPKGKAPAGPGKAPAGAPRKPKGD